MLASYLLIYLLLFVIGAVISVPIDHDDRDARLKDEEKLLKKVRREEYVRYAKIIVDIINTSEDFKQKYTAARLIDESTQEAIDKHFHLIPDEIRTKLNEAKRKEVQYQQALLESGQTHMSLKEQVPWNPIHHDNKDTFEKEDLSMLFVQLDDYGDENKRKRNFREYEMEKERKRKKKLQKMAADKTIEEFEQLKKKRVKAHEKIHEPGHKAQLEEVWEKQDGMDPENFDYRTFFNLHDKNGDGKLDEYEYETIFLYDLDKVYNETDPEVDMYERDEEMREMWERAMTEYDHNHDGLISFDEFMEATTMENFVRDDEWEPLVEKENFTPEEYEQYKLKRQMYNGEDDEEDDEYE